ncbi:MAG TPA: hypothetical protein VGN26_07570, partial [Armatimonadota bacterium]
DDSGGTLRDAASTDKWLYNWGYRLATYTAKQNSTGVFACPNNLWFDTFSSTWVEKPDARQIPRFDVKFPGLAADEGGRVRVSGTDGISTQANLWFPCTYGISHLAAGVDSLKAGAGEACIIDALEAHPSQAILLGETRLPDTILTYVDPCMAALGATVKLIGPTAAERYPPYPPGGRIIHTHSGRTNWLFLDLHVEALTVRQTLVPENRWTTRPIDQSAFDDLATHLAPEYQ